MILVFWMLSFKPGFSLSFFIFIRFYAYFDFFFDFFYDLLVIQKRVA